MKPTAAYSALLRALLLTMSLSTLLIRVSSNPYDVPDEDSVNDENFNHIDQDNLPETPELNLETSTNRRTNYDMFGHGNVEYIENNLNNKRKFGPRAQEFEKFINKRKSYDFLGADTFDYIHEAMERKNKHTPKRRTQAFAHRNLSI